MFLKNSFSFIICFPKIVIFNYNHMLIHITLYIRSTKKGIKFWYILPWRFYTYFCFDIWTHKNSLYHLQISLMAKEILIHLIWKSKPQELNLIYHEDFTHIFVSRYEHKNKFIIPSPNKLSLMAKEIIIHLIVWKSKPPIFFESPIHLIVWKSKPPIFSESPNLRN